MFFNLLSTKSPSDVLQPVSGVPWYSYYKYDCVFNTVIFVLLNCLGDRKDQKNLERLRAERLAKINELKEKTNYYTTQQLIQVIIK